MLPCAIISLLRCPNCGARLHSRPEALRCEGECGTTFPVMDGMPILLNEQRSLFSAEDFARRAETFFQRKSRIIEALDRVVSSTSVNLTARDNYRELLRQLRRRTQQPLVLVVGGGIPGDGFGELQRLRAVQL